MILTRLAVFSFMLCWQTVILLNNGLALKPPMGWMSWGHYECKVNCSHKDNNCLNEDLILTVADRMYSDGYLDAGYEYIIIDDCWSEMDRENGKLVADRKRFPRGMKFLADYIHSKGLKFGMYTNVGPTTCKGYPGSLFDLGGDAIQFANWGVDYLKVDGCFVGEDVLNKAYIELGKDLNDTGRPIVFSCSWPYYIRYIHRHMPNYTAVSKHCNLWRDFHDIFPYWDNVVWVIKHFEDMYSDMMIHHGPGHWFDPDMLLVGRNILTPGQNRVQMAVYTIISAPLIISCDMTKISEHEAALLKNSELLAVGQSNALAEPFKIDKYLTIWVKTHPPKKGNTYPAKTFAIVNIGARKQKFTLIPKMYGANSSEYTVYDNFQLEYLRNITRNESIKVIVPAQDVLMYTLYAL